jgi:hypothetical protein
MFSVVVLTAGMLATPAVGQHADIRAWNACAHQFLNDILRDREAVEQFYGGLNDSWQYQGRTGFRGTVQMQELNNCVLQSREGKAQYKPHSKLRGHLLSAPLAFFR